MKKTAQQAQPARRGRKRLAAPTPGSKTEKIVKALLEGQFQTAVAKTCKVSPQFVSQVAARFEVKSNKAPRARGPQVSKEACQKVIDWLDAHPEAVFAKGVTAVMRGKFAPATVQYACSVYGLKRTSRVNPANRKFSAAQVRSLRAKYQKVAEDKRWAFIEGTAQKHGVSTEGVRLMLNGRTYRWVE